MISGHVNILAPKKVSISQKMIVDSYSDILWDKTPQGDVLKLTIDKIIEGKTDCKDTCHEVWLLTKVKDVT